MQIGVIGVNHKLADIALRDMIARACQRRFFLENPLQEGSYVLLSTCNRTELYFSAQNLVQAHQECLSILKAEVAEDFEQKLYTFFGFDCFFHLAKVTAGLDSALIAETEIQGQVKGAYVAGADLRALSKDLHYLFQKCLKIGKEMRSCYQFEKDLPDIRHALIGCATSYFEKLPPVLLIGASEINIKIASFLRQKGISVTFSNRSNRAIPEGFDLLEWCDLHTHWHTFDWVIAATKSPHYLLTEKPAERQKLLIDLAIPRNIDPRLESTQVRLLNIDQLHELVDKRRVRLEERVHHLNTHLVTLVLRQINSFQSKVSYCIIN